MIEGTEITIPAGTDIGWVIDGQHRLAGAHEAENDYEFCVIGVMGLPEEEQVELFVTINREAKGVPTSLVLDLLGRIPKKRPSDFANERAVDLSKRLRDDPESPLFLRIVVDSPRAGQVSLANFVRKVTPLVHQDKGRLADYSFEEQAQILDNYFSAIREVFSDEWNKSNPVFFRTIGFGAMLNVFEKVFNECTERNASFQISDVKRILGLVSDFDFDQWNAYGSGNKAEQDAAKDVLIDLTRALKMMDDKGKIKRLKL